MQLPKRAKYQLSGSTGKPRLVISWEENVSHILDVQYWGGLTPALWHHIHNLLKNIANLQRCQSEDIFLMKMWHSKSTMTPRHHILHISDFFMQFICVQISHEFPLPSIGKHTDKCWNCAFCNTNNILRSQAYRTLLSYATCMIPCLSLRFKLCNMTNDVTGALYSTIDFLVNNSRINLDERKRHRCNHNALQNRMITNLTFLAQSVTLLGLTRPFDLGINFQLDFANKNYTTWRAVSKQTQWCLNFALLPFHPKLLAKTETQHLGH